MGEPKVCFDAAYEEVVALNDGTAVTVRLIRPSDRELLREGFRRLSAKARYLRFFVGKNDLSEHELDYLTQCDQVNHLAIGAINQEGTTGLGVARFIRLQHEPKVAEAAIVVSDEVQGKGLGRALFQRLIFAARERGVERFRSEVLAENNDARSFLLSLAPEATVDTEANVVVIEFLLPDLSDDLPQAAGSPMYRLFAMAAEGLVEIRRAVDRLGALIDPSQSAPPDDPAKP